jgi:hypothetical protein
MDSGRLRYCIGEVNYWHCRMNITTCSSSSGIEMERNPDLERFILRPKVLPNRCSVVTMILRFIGWARVIMAESSQTGVRSC